MGKNYCLNFETMRDYPIEALNKLSAAIRNEEDAQQWLVDNGYRELSEFWDAYEEVEKSFQWLKNNGYLQFAALIDAMSGNVTAKTWLLRNDYRWLAAFADAAEGNKTAIDYLITTPEKLWLTVAKTIYDYEKKKKKRGFLSTLFNLGNPYK
jgi:hypothetical protein